MVKEYNTFNQNILFLHSSLQDEKVNLRLFDEVYMIGNTAKLQKGVIEIEGVSELNELLKYKE